MGLFVSLLALIALLLTSIPIIVSITEKKTKDKKRRAEQLKSANKLYQCKVCNRYSRHYQQVLKNITSPLFRDILNGFKRIDVTGEIIENTPDERYKYVMSNYDYKACPHCYADNRMIEVYDEPKFTEFHDDCIKLIPETLDDYNLTIEQTKMLSYESSRREKFIEEDKY